MDLRLTQVTCQLPESFCATRYTIKHTIHCISLPGISVAPRDPRLSYKKNWMFFFPFVLFYVLRAWLCDHWEYSFWSLLSRECTLMATWIGGFSVCQAMPALSRVSCERSQAMGTFVHCYCWKVPFLSGTCLVSEISGFVTGGVSNFCGRSQTVFTALSLLPVQ